MKIDFTGRQTEIPDGVRRLAERKLARIEKLLPNITHARVILTADKHRVSAEVSVHSRQRDLAAVAVTDKPQLSVSEAIEKLTRQVEKHRTRRQTRKGAESPRLVEALVAPPRAAVRPAATGRQAPAPDDGSAGPRVIRSRRTVVKPMTLDEAALELDGRGEGVLVFRDAATARVNVLFRRKDGNLGLIEPEA